MSITTFTFTFSLMQTTIMRQLDSFDLCIFWTSWCIYFEDDHILCMTNFRKYDTRTLKSQWSILTLTQKKTQLINMIEDCYGSNASHSTETTKCIRNPIVLFNRTCFQLKKNIFTFDHHPGYALKPMHVYCCVDIYGTIWTNWLNLVWFYGISTIVGYLMPNLLYTYILNIYNLVWLSFMAYQPLKVI